MDMTPTRHWSALQFVAAALLCLGVWMGLFNSSRADVSPPPSESNISTAPDALHTSLQRGLQQLSTQVSDLQTLGLQTKNNQQQQSLTFSQQLNYLARDHVQITDLQRQNIQQLQSLQTAHKRLQQLLWLLMAALLLLLWLLWRSRQPKARQAPAATPRQPVTHPPAPAPAPAPAPRTESEPPSPVEPALEPEATETETATEPERVPASPSPAPAPTPSWATLVADELSSTEQALAQTRQSFMQPARIDS